MLSWKYAAIYHILLKEEGTEIQAKSFDYGIKVSLMFLSSIKKIFRLQSRFKIWCQRS